MRRKMIALGVTCLFVGGCTPVDHGFGETHRQNIALQVVDPDPQYAGDEIEGGSGVRAVEAIDRYNRGEVTEPARVATTSSGSGSSSSGSGGTPQE